MEAEIDQPSLTYLIISFLILLFISKKGGEVAAVNIVEKTFYKDTNYGHHSTQCLAAFSFFSSFFNCFFSSSFFSSFFSHMCTPLVCLVAVYKLWCVSQVN